MNLPVLSLFAQSNNSLELRALDYCCCFAHSMVKDNLLEIRISFSLQTLILQFSSFLKYHSMRGLEFCTRDIRDIQDLKNIEKCAKFSIFITKCMILRQSIFWKCMILQPFQLKFMQTFFILFYTSIIWLPVKNLKLTLK